MTLHRGDTVTLNPEEMRDRTRERFLSYHGDYEAKVVDWISEYADDYDGLWIVEMVDTGQRHHVRRGAITRVN